MYEYRMWLHRQTDSPADVEKELTRLSREHLWRCVGFVPTAVMTNQRVSGHFLLEREVSR